VLADADLERAAAAIAESAMGCAGQRCTATRRVLVEAPVHERFRDMLVAAIEALIGLVMVVLGLALAAWTFLSRRRSHM